MPTDGAHPTCPPELSIDLLWGPIQAAGLRVSPALADEEALRGFLNDQPSDLSVALATLEVAVGLASAAGARRLDSVHCAAQLHIAGGAATFGGASGRRPSGSRTLAPWRGAPDPARRRAAAGVGGLDGHREPGVEQSWQERDHGGNGWHRDAGSPSQPQPRSARAPRRGGWTRPSRPAWGHRGSMCRSCSLNVRRVTLDGRLPLCDTGLVRESRWSAVRTRPAGRSTLVS